MSSEYLMSLLDNFSINWTEVYLVFSVGFLISRLFFFHEKKKEMAEGNPALHMLETLLSEKTFKRTVIGLHFTTLILVSLLWPVSLVGMVIIRVKGLHKTEEEKEKENE